MHAENFILFDIVKTQNSNLTTFLIEVDGQQTMSLKSIHFVKS